MKRLSILVSGRVQGVGFRYFTEEIAEQTGVSGWVRNTMDGDVEIEVQGEVSQLKIFSKQIKEGPALAYVKDYHEEELPVQVNEKDFGVRY